MPCFRRWVHIWSMKSPVVWLLMLDLDKFDTPASIMTCIFPESGQFCVLFFTQFLFQKGSRVGLSCYLSLLVCLFVCFKKKQNLTNKSFCKHYLESTCHNEQRQVILVSDKTYEGYMLCRKHKLYS